MQDFLDDGYTDIGKIEAEHGAHGALDFTYRPALGDARAKLLAKLNDPTAFHAQACELLPQLLMSWSLKDGKCGDVKIAKGTLAKVRPALLNKVIDIVFGFSKNEAAADVENDLKNSP